jgi:Ca2+/Na+ antiporter
MYDIRQFKPALYILLLLGMSGFALAAQWPGMWVLSVAAIGLNGWLMKTGRFHPMPRLIASAITILAFLYTGDQLLHSQTTPILVIGQFLVLLQLVKLYEQRANRDYAQLSVLSLLLMVAAAINTASLIFGVMFIAYLFLSLYCCLLFHLKVESEQARKAIMVLEHEPNPATLRQDQRYLSSSMRRLTGLISLVSVAAAIFVFLFFPRGAGQNLLGALQFHQSRALTGFSEQVQFQQVARISQNDAVVAHVKVWHNNVPVEGTQPLLLRGLTLERYNGAEAVFRGRGVPWQWNRRLPQGAEMQADAGENIDLDGEPEVLNDVWRTEITLQPTGTQVLFSLAGPVSVRPTRRSTIQYSPWDETLRTSDNPTAPLQYEVTSRGHARWVEPPKPNWERLREAHWGMRGDRPWIMLRPRHSDIDPKITEYARRPEVCGTDSAGRSLAERRDEYVAAERARRGLEPSTQPFDTPQIISPFDEQIARTFERHLHSPPFTYTLDLTDAKKFSEDSDPMVEFLYNLKRGHCEYYAGAMTLMCQSLGMQARMVIGFACDEYNDVGGYYIVTQAQAHAWVECAVLPPAAPVPPGQTAPASDAEAARTPIWLTFDPTSGRQDATIRRADMWTRLRHVFDYMEYSWANNVIAYDRGSRDNLVQNMETRLTKTAVSSTDHIQRFPEWLRTENWKLSSALLTILIVLSALALVFAVAWFLWERWRLRRRAARIGLDALPARDQIRLVRQLGFYDDLLQLLERRGIIRPAHLTPLEFSDSLSFLPYEAYVSIRRLTNVFYRIRYGRAVLSSGNRERLNQTIGRLESALNPLRSV